MIEAISFIAIVILQIVVAVKVHFLDMDIRNATKRLDDLNERAIRVLVPGYGVTGKVTDPFKGANQLPLRKVSGVVGTKTPAQIRAEHSREIEKGVSYGWMDNNAR
mgnify:FL=1